jgi:calcineurin-like phosphoesterase family protein
LGNFFTSDYHFSHFNIMRYCDRPFSSTREMDEAIIENHNKKVKSTDNVYFLGDFAFVKDPLDVERFVNRLNGKFHWVFGNHDFKYGLINANGFKWKGDYLRLNIGDMTLCLFHYQIRTWDKKHYGSIHLYGHDHNRDWRTGVPNERSLNVGVDCHNFEPLEYEEVLEILRKKDCDFPDFSLGKIKPL